MGCGAGYISAEIAGHYSARLTGIDFDVGSIAHAKKVFGNNPAFSFICGDGSQVSFETSVFDLICFCDSLHFTRTDEKLYALLDKCRIMLKPGGKIAIFRGADNNQVTIWSQNNNISLTMFDLCETNKKLYQNAYSELKNMASELRSEIPETYEMIKNDCIEHVKHDGWGSRQLYILSKR